MAEMKWAAINGEARINSKDLLKLFPIPLRKEFKYEAKDANGLAQALAGYAKKEKERQGVKEMRILKGWTEKERKELEKARDCMSIFEVALRIVNGDACFKGLSERHLASDLFEDNVLAMDIADYMSGFAKFPEPKKYYVHLIRNDYNTYLQLTDLNERRMGDKYSLSKKTRFTKEEALAIDPRFEPFLEEVPEDELSED